MTGKTSFIDHYINNKFNDQIITIGIDFYTKTIKYKNNIIKLQFWDTGGQERFAPLVKNYYTQVDAIIIMFDLTDYINLKKLNYWLSECKDRENIIIVLVGNKIDICDKNNFNSLLNDIPIKSEFGITGEIQMSGEVTAIGGLSNKILGSIKANVKSFIYPKENKKDFDEFYEKYKESDILTGIKFYPIEHIKEALELILDK